MCALLGGYLSLEQHHRASHESGDSADLATPLLNGTASMRLANRWEFRLLRTSENPTFHVRRPFLEMAMNNCAARISAFSMKSLRLIRDLLSEKAACEPSHAMER